MELSDDRAKVPIVTNVPSPAVKIDEPLRFPDALLDDVVKMIKAESGREYYQFTLGAEPDGSLYCSAYTHFVNWADESRLHEIRQPSLVKGAQAFEQLAYINQPALVVTGARQFVVWSSLGGHGIVERATAEEFMPDRLAPSSSAPAPVGSGFVGLAGRSRHELQYAPSPKLRMQILKRDRYRCRTCGRSPANHVDLELHVHHVRPWGLGGLTHPLNLLTLCSTCHRGLPARQGSGHYDPALHDLVPGVPPRRDPSRAAVEYRDAVLRYRDQLARMWDEHDEEDDT